LTDARCWACSAVLRVQCVNQPDILDLGLQGWCRKRDRWKTFKKEFPGTSTEVVCGGCAELAFPCRICSVGAPQRRRTLQGRVVLLQVCGQQGLMRGLDDGGALGPADLLSLAKAFPIIYLTVRHLTSSFFRRRCLSLCPIWGGFSLPFEPFLCTEPFLCILTLLYELLLQVQMVPHVKGNTPA
jgi:hypothetical protein